MTYTAPKLNQSQQFTCFSCPNFENFNGERGRGLCKYHDQVTFEHHQSTDECIYALEKKSNQHLQSYEQAEDIPYSEFEPGQKVKVIDDQEDHTEWASFVVITKIINVDRFNSHSSYLEPDWYYLIASVDRPTQHQFWVAENEICHVEQSRLIETAEVL